MSIQNSYETDPQISRAIHDPAYEAGFGEEIPEELEAQLDFSADELGLTSDEAAELAAAEDAWPDGEPEDGLIQPLY